MNQTAGASRQFLLQIRQRDKFTNFMRTAALSSSGIAVFILVWSAAAASITTSLGQFPGPSDVWQQVRLLFWPQALTSGPNFLEQMTTSLLTVAAGFTLAMLIALPLGIICGLNSGIYSAINPIIQILKPVSPLAWLPLVTMVVGTLQITESAPFNAAFVTSAITVALCCLWPAVINTTVGVAGVDKDLLNVSRVMGLPAHRHIQKIVLPAAVPMIFTGMRMSLTTGWMVLIAAEMLAQNPGLGKFIWDEFQNASSDALGRIMVALLVIGSIGFVLDKIMLLLQRRLSWDKQALYR